MSAPKPNVLTKTPDDLTHITDADKTWVDGRLQAAYDAWSEGTFGLKKGKTAILQVDAWLKKVPVADMREQMPGELPKPLLLQLHALFTHTDEVLQRISIVAAESLFGKSVTGQEVFQAFYDTAKEIDSFLLDLTLLWFPQWVVIIIHNDLVLAQAIREWTKEIMKKETE